MEQGSIDKALCSVPFYGKSKIKCGPLQRSLLFSFCLQRTLLTPPLKERAEERGESKYFSLSGLFGRGL